MTAILEALIKRKAQTIFDATWEESGNFRMELDYDLACAYIECIGQYNDFDPSLVLTALEHVDDIIPTMQYGEGNPNNGKRDYKISVGREGSPVIYINRYELHRMDSPKVPLTPDMVTHVKTAMEGIAQADEADCKVEDYRQHGMGLRYTFRFWWD